MKARIPYHIQGCAWWIIALAIIYCWGQSRFVARDWGTKIFAHHSPKCMALCTSLDVVFQGRKSFQLFVLCKVTLGTSAALLDKTLEVSLCSIKILDLSISSVQVSLVCDPEQQLDLNSKPRRVNWDKICTGDNYRFIARILTIFIDCQTKGIFT